ncbi:MAG: LLM class flavin-dependent oxidoreductase [Acidimicrobiales bacterium]|nr:LLM class flavin-dependent oxidoreductase [Acidimicrobiales bacterium]
MRIGIDIPHSDERGNVLDVKGIMRRAAMVEAAGLDGIWNGDGSFFRGSYTEVDPLLWMAGAAAGTEHIELGLTVYQVPLREPVDLAQRLMTITQLARGRFTCGVGSGSTEQGAFSFVGVPFEDRFRILYRSMARIRRLLDGETDEGVVLPPWPGAVKGPRFVLGGWHSPISLKRAATEYDGWMSSSGLTNLRVMSEGIKRYRDLGGTRAMTTTCRIDLRAPNRKLSDEEPFNVVCGPEEAAERLGRVAELGFDDVCLRFVDHRQRIGFASPSYSADDLEEIRSLVPKDGRRPYEA